MKKHSSLSHRPALNPRRVVMHLLTPLQRIITPQRTAWAASLLLVAGMTGCAAPEPPAAELDSQAENAATQGMEHSDQPVEQDDRKVVLTTFTVLADMAQNIAGEQLRVESITRIGAEIHGYEPTPSDIAKAQEADLILYNGMGLERWFEQFLGNLDEVPSALLTEGIEAIPISEGPYGNQPNPHAWMSPKNALVYVENIRRALVELDPENAELYDANAAEYSDRLSAIDTELAADLAQVPASQRFLVSCEGAFSYLAQDYGLEEVYMWPINAERQFTPKQVSNVIEQVEANNIPTIFCESTVSDEGQRQVAQTTGAQFGGNLYVDSLSTEDGPVPTFLDLLEYDARTISDGLLGGIEAAD